MKKEEIVKRLNSLQLHLEVLSGLNPNDGELEDRIDDLEEIISSLTTESKLSAEEVLEKYESVIYEDSPYTTSVAYKRTDCIQAMHNYAQSKGVSDEELKRENQLLKLKIHQVGDISLKWFLQLEVIDNLKRQVELQKAQIDKFELDNLCANNNSQNANDI